VKPAQKRSAAQFFRTGFRVSERRACRLAGVARSSYRYRSVAADQTALRLRLRDLAATRVRYGYRRLHVLLRREGWRVNHTRVYRLYREEGLGIRVKRRKKLASAPRVVPLPPTKPLERWSLDFLSESLVDGRRFRVLTIVDTVSRVSPAIAVDHSLTGERVVATLERLKQTVGKPDRIAVDNEPEFISKAVDAWAYQRGRGRAPSPKNTGSSRKLVIASRAASRSLASSFSVALIKAQVFSPDVRMVRPVEPEGS
jgi:putative transposase